MRAITLAILAALSCFLTSAAQADILQLANGGKLDGTLEKITIAVNDGELSVPRNSIADLELASGTVVLKTDTGRAINGLLVSLTFQSVGGQLTFQREEVFSLQMVDDPLASARKELAERREKLRPNDAAGLLQLAKWCLGKGLKTDAAELVRLCLKAEPNGRHAKEAHELLGHVFRNGRWITSAEAAGLGSDPDGTASTEVGTTPAIGSTAQPDAAALKQALAENDKLYEVSQELVGKEKDKALEALKTKYRERLTETEAKVKRLQAEVLERERLRLGEREKFLKETKAGFKKAEIERMVWQKFDDPYCPLNAAIRATKDNLMQAQFQSAELQLTVRATQTQVLDDETRRNDALRLAWQKNRRALLAGTVLTIDEMKDAFAAAMNLN